MATATKQRRRIVEAAKGKNGSSPYVAAQFAAGSLETELSAIGRAVPAREWAKVPDDYFANLEVAGTGGWGLGIGVSCCPGFWSGMRIFARSHFLAFSERRESPPQSKPSTLDLPYGNQAGRLEEALSL